MLTSPHPPQTLKFTKHTWREQVHKDVKSPPAPPKPRSSRSIHVSKFTGMLTSPHPTQTPKFTKHTWREQVHKDVNIPPTPPKPRSSRSIHDVSKFTGTLTSPPPQTQTKSKKRGFVTSCVGAALVTKMVAPIKQLRVYSSGGLTFHLLVDY